MAKFCPICKANCGESCGLYLENEKECGFTALSSKLEYISDSVNDLAKSIDSLSAEVNKLR